MRQDDERGEYGPGGLTHIAADLEERLREPVPPARGHARHARGFGMEDGRARSHQRHGDQQHGEARRVGERQQSRQREAHAGRQRVGERALVGIEADHRLQQACRELEGQGDDANLPEVEPELVLQDRVDGRNERLYDVIQAMRDADRDQDAEDRALRRGLGVDGLCPGSVVGRGGHAKSSNARTTPRNDAS